MHFPFYDSLLPSNNFLNQPALLEGKRSKPHYHKHNLFFFYLHPILVNYVPRYLLDQKQNSQKKAISLGYSSKISDAKALKCLLLLLIH